MDPRFENNRQPSRPNNENTEGECRTDFDARTQYLRDQLYSRDVHVRIRGMRGLATIGTHSTEILDCINRRMSCATSGDERAEACRTLLSDRHHEALIGLRIEGIAQYLAFARLPDPRGVADAAIEFLLARSSEELLLSPSAFALLGLNPSLRDKESPLYSPAELLLRRLASKDDGCIGALRAQDGAAWADRVGPTVQILRQTSRPELVARADLIDTVESLRGSVPTSREHLDLRYKIVRICHQQKEKLLSQSVGERLAGSLRHTVGNSVDWLTGSVGAASAEQLLRLALQALPIRELRLGFQRDTGSFGGISKVHGNLEDRLAHAYYLLGLEQADRYSCDTEYLVPHRDLVAEFENRGAEIIPKAAFSLTCGELLGLTQSALSGVETLSIPESLFQKLDPDIFPHLKRLELFRTDRIALDSCEPGIASRVTSLALSQQARLSIFRSNQALANIHEIELCDMDECFSFSDLQQRYGLHSVRAIALEGSPSSASLKNLLLKPGVSSLRFPWSSELDTFLCSERSSVQRLEIDAVSPDCVLALRDLEFLQLRHLALHDIQGGLTQLKLFLDTLKVGQVDAFEISTGESVGHEILEILEHPALSNVSHLTLGLPRVVDLIRILSSTESPMRRLHSIGFENKSVGSVESGNLSKVELGFLSKWVNTSLCEIRYPWPLSESSLLMQAARDESALKCGGTAFSVVQDQFNQNRSNASFILALTQ